MGWALGRMVGGTVGRPVTGAVGGGAVRVTPAGVIGAATGVASAVGGAGSGGRLVSGAGRLGSGPTEAGSSGSRDSRVTTSPEVGGAVVPRTPERGRTVMSSTITEAVPTRTPPASRTRRDRLGTGRGAGSTGDTTGRGGASPDTTIRVGRMVGGPTDARCARTFEVPSTAGVAVGSGSAGPLAWPGPPPAVRTRYATAPATAAAVRAIRARGNSVTRLQARDRAETARCYTAAPRRLSGAYLGVSLPSSSLYDSASSPVSEKPPHARKNSTTPVATNTPRNA